MEVEKHMSAESPSTPAMEVKSPENCETWRGDRKSAKESLGDSRCHLSGGVCSPSESFRKLEMGVPTGESGEDRLTWLRSQILGGDAQFDSLFGRRRLTYADHTASGRCLRYIENFIIDNVLPFYGKSKI